MAQQDLDFIKFYHEIFSFFIAVFFLNSCAKSNFELRDQASKAEAQNGFTAKTYQTKEFKIFTLQKISNPLKVIRVYIEGDGKAFNHNGSIALNSTPTSHFLIDLIAKDNFENILYIARPCQFIDDEKCQNNGGNKYWSSARFSEEAIDAVGEVLESFSDYKIELVGYSGGAVFARYFATNNKNIINFRSIAGNLDHQKFNEIHKVPQLKDSLSDIDLGYPSNIAQIHFVGSKDRVVPKLITKTYVEKLLDDKCVKIVEVKGATHAQNWNQKWQDLLRITPLCKD